jgi:hypothetical protein
VIDGGFLVQRHADSPDDAAEDLAARRLGVQDAPAATALTMRVTRITPSCSSILTSAKTAEWVLWARPWSSAGWW